MSALDPMRLHSRDAFQLWLANDFEVREELRELLVSSGRDALSLEPESLRPLEEFLLERYPTIADATRLDQRSVVDAAARHVGFIMILNIDGAEWSIDLDNEDSVYYRLPIVRFSDEDEECPLSMVTTAIDRRTGTFLSDLVMNYASVYNAAE